MSMKLSHRRQFLRLAAGAVALPAISHIARAQAYPSPPVRIIVSIIASVDELLVQLVGQWLTERLGQPFIVDNQPSAGARIGAEAIVSASPDGHPSDTLPKTRFHSRSRTCCGHQPQPFCNGGQSISSSQDHSRVNR